MAYQRILVPVDGSRTSTAGVREALDLARAMNGKAGRGASVQLVHVIDYHTLAMAGLEAGGYVANLSANLRQSGKQILERAEDMVRKAGVPVSSVLLESAAGPAADAIVRQAKKWKADVIVLGTHGRRGVRRMLMGSDAEQIVRSSPVPVMLVRAPGR
jgi:nucleotide-binding universal stress UspA family protein